MKLLPQVRRLLAVAILLLGVPSLYARHNDAWARSQFATAERLRESLNGRPSKDRTRREYQRAIDAYRRVYFGCPTCSKADPSVVATAELMVEMGRRFDDERELRAAIAQYQFLRKQYPGSKYRFGALFTIGEVYKDDLDEAKQARATFQDFLHRYPRNHLADEARQALTELSQQARKDKAAKSGKVATGNAADAGAGPDESRQLPRVTGIRHWSTPDYTRVAVDLEGKVEFESQRIAGPDRIFLDLQDSRLASTLVGKTFDVDDGFLKKIRVAEAAPGKTRIVLEVDELSRYDAFLLPDPYRLIIDIHGKPSSNLDAANSNDAAKNNEPVLKPAAPKADVAVVPSQAGRKTAESARISGNSELKDLKPYRAVQEPPVASAKSKASAASVTGAERATITANLPAKTTGGKKSRHKTVDSEVADIHAAQPTASGDRSLIRALGLKINKIVIDAGHGGYDTGTIGPSGLQEKDLVLEVALRLGKLLESRLGAEVVYTRPDDTFIPLETRTAIANQQQADLFISVHANSSRDPGARGVETYYLNFTSSPDALEVAARENAVSGAPIHDLQDLVKKIAMKEKIEESREFAGDVQQALHSGLAAKSPAIRNRGVKKAPFVVLIGANMPSILAEISFVSNPTDEQKLETSDYRQRIAESLYKGVSKYVGGLSGVRVASKIEKNEGQ